MEQTYTPTDDTGKEMAPIESTAVATAIAQEIQGAIILAKRFPRDETAVWQKLMESMKRGTMAESARYAYPRGGQQITGPSVHLARVAAQCWGNVRFGIDIIRSTEIEVTIRGWAWDIENNTKVTQDDSFRKLIYRKPNPQKNIVGGWIQPDERELRELINRRGAIAVRNCLLQIIPRDMVEDAMAVAKQTLTSGLKDPEAEKKRLVMAFSDLGVTVEMMAKYIGFPAEEWGPDHIVDLKAVLLSIKDGNSKRDDYFPSNKEEAPKTKTDALADKLNGKSGKQEKLGEDGQWE